jgi:hypothetical protein
MMILKFLSKICSIIYDALTTLKPTNNLPKSILNKIDLIYNNDEEKKECLQEVTQLIKNY